MTDRIVNLDDVLDEDYECDPALMTLRMLNALKGETHRVWRITPSAGGAWNYEKVYVRFVGDEVTE